MSTNPVLDLEVFVPSRSRWERSLTLEALQGKWDRVALVVPAAQVAKYRPLATRHGVRLLPCPAQGIAGTRQWIGRMAKGHFIMLDDDLRFYTRAKEGVALFQFGKHDMSAMLIYVHRLLDLYAHVAISAREGNNRLDYPWVTNSRPLRALAYRKGPFIECEHGRVAIMEDFDVTLQLLKMGYRNCILTAYAQDQPGTQAPGGCSDYRTHALHEANVRKMHKLHGDLVKLRQKENKTGGEFGTRLEATIYWEKAHKAGMEDLFG
jgi:hypothetical protein